MKILFIAVLACMASMTHSAPSVQRTVVAGPSGVVTGIGAIGPNGYSNGFWTGYGNQLGRGYGYGAANGYSPVSSSLIGRSPIGYGYSGSAITPGGGSITASGHGATIVGPPTAPVLVAGPSGKVVADGLWGPTANVGGYGSYGSGRGYGW